MEAPSKAKAKARAPSDPERTSTAKDETPAVREELLRHLWRFVKPYRSRLTLGVLAALGVALISTALAGLVKLATALLQANLDEQARAGQPQASEESTASSSSGLPTDGVEQMTEDFVSGLDPSAWPLWVVPVALIGLSALRGACRYSAAFCIGTSGSLMVRDLRTHLFGHLVRLPVTWHAKNPSGVLVSRVVRDVGAMHDGAIIAIKELIQNSLMVLMLGAFAIWTDPLTAGIALVVVPLAVLPMARILRGLRKISRDGADRVAHLSHHVSETFGGLPAIKLLGAERAVTAESRKRADSFADAEMRAIRIGELTAPVTELTSAFAFAIVISLGGYRVSEGLMGFDSLTGLFAALGLMTQPLRALGKVQGKLHALRGTLGRVVEILRETPEEQAELTVSTSERQSPSELRYEGVDFGYPGGDHPVLRQLNLSIQPGEVLALAGPSGVGKSTLAALLFRFQVPNAGQLLLDGRNISQLPLGELRGKIGWVGQTPFLFDGSVRENLSIGSADGIPDERLLEALDAVQGIGASAGADEAESGGRLDLDTPAGERGSQLSGGQRQRVAFARALLSPQPIMVLDEPTAALDPASERVLISLIERLRGRATVILIAHRREILAVADRIAILGQGRVQALGTWQELERQSALDESMLS